MRPLTTLPNKLDDGGDVVVPQEEHGKLRKIKGATDTLCPRCGRRSVRKDLRKCSNCKGALLWPGDTAAKMTSDWFMWYPGYGWVHSSFFVATGKSFRIKEGYF